MGCTAVRPSGDSKGFQRRPCQAHSPRSPIPAPTGRGVLFDRKALTGVVVDNVERADFPAADQLVANEVLRPFFVGARRCLGLRRPPLRLRRRTRTCCRLRGRLCRSALWFSSGAPFQEEHRQHPLSPMSPLGGCGPRRLAQSPRRRGPWPGNRKLLPLRSMSLHIRRKLTA